MSVPSAEQGPSLEEVNRHAVIEGLAMGACTAVLTVVGLSEVSEAIIGDEKVALINHASQTGQSADIKGVSELDSAIFISPIIIAPLAALGVYRVISSRIRRRGGSPMIGYHPQAPVNERP